MDETAQDSEYVGKSEKRLCTSEVEVRTSRDKTASLEEGVSLG